jgi:hypothetical protein
MGEDWWLQKLGGNEITMKLDLTQWGGRILPFIFPRGKFSGGHIRIAGGGVEWIARLTHYSLASTAPLSFHGFGSASIFTGKTVLSQNFHVFSTLDIASAFNHCKFRFMSFGDNQSLFEKVTRPRGDLFQGSCNQRVSTRDFYDNTEQR